MVNPLASAVIITYNQEKYIEQTIECALAQKVDFEYEIVIGEDCSTDRTREICLQYQEKYPNIIRVITSDNNVGLLENWCRSVKAARGKYIAGCGGDDYWHNPDKMQKQVMFLEENPDYGMVHSEHNNFCQKNGTLVKSYHETHAKYCDNSSNDLLSLIVLGKYWIMASTAVFRKDIFDKYFDLNEIKKNGFLMEDTPLFIEIAAHSRIYYFSESFSTYRVLTNAISQNQDIKKALNFKKSNLEMCLYYCKKHKLSEDVKKHLESNWRRVTLQLAFIDKHLDLAEIVKKKFPDLSIKEWFWYQGTRIPIMRPLVLLVKILFQKKPEL